MPVGYNIIDCHECESLYRDSCDVKQNWVTLKDSRGKFCVSRVLGEGGGGGGGTF